MKPSEIEDLDNSILKEVSAGINSVGLQLEQKSKENARSLVMSDLLLGLSFGPTTPECTDRGW